MATREPPVERFYSPEDLKSGAPRLYVWRDGSHWVLQDEHGTVLSMHPTQRDAVAGARARSSECFSEILVRGSTGRAEWLLDQDPELLALTTELDRYLALRREQEGE